MLSKRGIFVNKIFSNDIKKWFRFLFWNISFKLYIILNLSMSKELPTPQEAQILLEPVDAVSLEKVKRATVHIDCESADLSFGIQQQASGTGVHIGQGFIITARHTFKRFSEKPNIFVFNRQGGLSQEAEVIYSSDTLDLGILRVDDPGNLGRAEIRPEKLTPCQTIIIATYPYPSYLNVFRGIYLGDRTDFDPNRLAGSFLFYHSIDPNVRNSTVWSGASGSGIFNTDGQLVGMAYARLANGEPKAVALTGESICKALEIL